MIQKYLKYSMVGQIKRRWRNRYFITVLIIRKLKILQASEEAIQAKMAMDRRYIGSLHPGMQRLLVSLTKRRNLLIDKYIFYIKFISHLQTNVLEL